VTADWVPPAPDANDAHLSLQSGPIASAVLGRVLGMLAARADCPIDRLDDALLITDAIAAHAPTHSTDGRVTVTITARRGELMLVVSELRPGGGQELIVDSAVPGVGSVLERVADDVSHRESAAGGEELVVALGFEPGGRENGEGERSDAT
jgi:hypothetical protein